MALQAPSLACLCATKAFPSSLAECADITCLDCDLETLALLGTQLSDALITTNNGAAFLTCKGGYGRYQTNAMPHVLSRHRVNLRIAPDTPTTVARGPKGIQGRQALLVATPQGDIFHRIETADLFDHALIGSVDTRSMPVSNLEPPNHNGIVSLTAVRNARAYWHDRDAGQHLNDILHDMGKTRRMTLPHVGANNARQVVGQVLSSFVTYLHDHAISHAQLVPGYGLIQSTLCRGGEVSLAQKILIAQSERQTLALDLAQIDSLWVTRFARLSQLELYGTDGRAIAILAPDPNGDVQRWNALLESLPLAAQGKTNAVSDG